MDKGKKRFFKKISDLRQSEIFLEIIHKIILALKLYTF